MAADTAADENNVATNFTDDETILINALWTQSNQNDAILQELVIQALPTMSPKLIMKLKQQSSNTEHEHLTNNNESVVQQQQAVAMALQSVLDERLASGRQVLATLLAAGELRKLDAEIGKACRAGKLDMAYFTVLDMNLQDAAISEAEEEVKDGFQRGEATRLSILKHIYTRCQEEVEKLVPAGVALLNKLLRTDVDSIRANQLQHYLCPQPNVITLPDGQQIPVKDAEQNKVLVPALDLIDAISTAILQIRTVEKAGGVPREAAANMVEACRTVAKEARIVIGQNYGSDSNELQEFEEGLQPVFRPDSAESEFIQGL